MNKKILSASNYLLLLLLLLNNSCSESSHSKIVNNHPTDEVITPEYNSQVGNYIVEIFEDRKGNLWFGTMEYGVACYDGKALSFLSKYDGLCGNTVMSITEDEEGNLWFGTHSGASKYDPRASRTSAGRFTNYAENNGLHGAGCQILIDRNGDIWAGTNHGAFRFDGASFSPFSLPNPGIEDPSYKWEAGKIWNLMEDRNGNIWFARDGYGVCKYNPAARPGEEEFTHFTKKDGLSSNNVCGLHEDLNGNIWFGSLSSDFPEYKDEGGLSRYDGKTITQFTDIEELSENDIYNIDADKSGNVWVSATGFGIYRFDLSPKNKEAASFTLFRETNRPDLTKRFAVQELLEDRKGTIWFGFSGGLFRFDPEARQVDKPEIVNVTVAGPWEWKSENDK